MQDAKNIYPSYFILISFLLYMVFFMIPSFMGFLFSFTNWTSMGNSIQFVGFQHFREIFGNSRYLVVIRNTLIFAIFTTIGKNIIGLGMALSLNKNFKSRNFLRTIFFFPVMLSPLIIGLVFKSIYAPDSGLLNNTLNTVRIFFGLGTVQIDWLGSIQTALGSVILVEIWRLVGQNMVIYIAGLQAIPNDYLEAAEIDGANYLQTVWNILIPQLRASISINLVLNVIAGLKVFDLVFVLTNGGPARSTEVLNTVIYKEYSSGRYGFSTALGLIMFIVTCIIAFSLLRIMTKED